jgi:hypothetical protein
MWHFLLYSLASPIPNTVIRGCCSRQAHGIGYFVPESNTATAILRSQLLFEQGGISALSRLAAKQITLIPYQPLSLCAAVYLWGLGTNALQLYNMNTIAMSRGGGEVSVS